MKKEAIRYIVDSSTVAIVGSSYETGGHGIEHHTVSPTTFKGESFPNEGAIPLDKAPQDTRSRIADAYDALINNNHFSSRVAAETPATSLTLTQDI